MLSLLIGAITAVVQAALVAVIYIDLRMRKEGLDLELERYVELARRRTAGRRPVRRARARGSRDVGSAAATPGSEQPPTWS